MLRHGAGSWRLWYRIPGQPARDSVNNRPGRQEILQLTMLSCLDADVTRRLDTSAPIFSPFTAPPNIIHHWTILLSFSMRRDNVSFVAEHGNTVSKRTSVERKVQMASLKIGWWLGCLASKRSCSHNIYLTWNNSGKIGQWNKTLALQPY